MRALHSFENNVSSKPLFFPKVDPRHVLVESFSKKIKAICSENGEVGEVGSMIFLLFQREVMLRRTPDPTLIKWANSLEFQGEQDGRDTLYVTYLVRKWLACLPPIFSQLSCLSCIQIQGEQTDEQQSDSAVFQKEGSEVHRTLDLQISDFRHPDILLKSLMEKFLQTIPFLTKEGKSLRESTWMCERGVFSMEEWWMRFVACFAGEEDLISGEMPAAGKLCIAQYLKEQVYGDTAKEEGKSRSTVDHLLSMLSRAEIHSFTG